MGWRCPTPSLSQSKKLSKRNIKIIQKSILYNFSLLLNHSQIGSNERNKLLKILFTLLLHHNPNIRSTAIAIIKQTNNPVTDNFLKKLIFQTDPYFFFKTILREEYKDPSSHLFPSNKRFLDKHIFYDISFLKCHIKQIFLLFDSIHQKNSILEVPLSTIESIMFIIQMFLDDDRNNEPNSQQDLLIAWALIFTNRLIDEANNDHPKYLIALLSNPLFRVIFEYCNEFKKQLTKNGVWMNTMTIENLSKKYLSHQKLEKLNLSEMFQLKKKTWTRSLKNFNVSKNRYKTVHGNPDYQVSIGKNNQYINAHHVFNLNNLSKIIAIQAPLNKGKISNIHEFWQMIWEQNTRQIVMLTDLNENGKEKAEIYWPQNEDRPLKLSNGFEIKLVKVSPQTPTLSLRIFEIKNTHSGKIRKIVHYWDRGWKSSQNPEWDDFFLLMHTVREIHIHKTEKLVVHCSSGDEQTGIFISLYNALDILEKTKTIKNLKNIYRIRKNFLHTFLFKIIKQMNQSRNFVFNQSQPEKIVSQLQFIYKCLDIYVYNREFLPDKHPFIWYIDNYTQSFEETSYKSLSSSS